MNELLDDLILCLGPLEIKQRDYVERLLCVTPVAIMQCASRQSTCFKPSLQDVEDGAMCDVS